MLSFLTPATYVEREVNGELLRFYPISVPTTFRLKGAGKALGRAFNSFYAMRQPSAGHKIKDVRDVQGNEVHEFETEAISIEMFKEKNLQSEIGLDQLIEALTAPPNWEAVCYAIAESLRDLRQEHGLTTEELCRRLSAGGPGKQKDDTVQPMPLPVLVEMLKGVLEANVSAFGEVGKRMVAKMNETLSDGTTTPAGENSKTAG